MDEINYDDGNSDNSSIYLHTITKFKEYLISIASGVLECQCTISNEDTVIQSLITKFCTDPDTTILYLSKLSPDSTQSNITLY
jgi:hypothetical protein